MTTKRRNLRENRDFGSILLWAGQGVLAALFLFAGGMKLIVPADTLTAGPVALPVLFLRFIGFCEVVGAIGLILPGLFRIHRELTPLAAAGLVIIMTGATVVTAIAGDVTPAMVPMLIAVLLVSIGRGRWHRLEAA